MNLRALTNHRFNFLVNIIFLLIILFSSKIYAADFNVSVTLISGATENLVTEQSVSVYELLDNGTKQKIRTETSDDKGIIFLALRGLDQGKRYFLKTSSPFDGKTKESDLISSPGSFDFTIGNKLLHITVSNGINHAPLANHKVTIYQQLSNGSRKGFKNVITDDNGKLALDLPGLGSQTTYELRTLLQYGSSQAYSGAINSTAPYAFIIGNARTKVVNGRTKAAIANHNINVFYRNTDGTETKISLAKTNENGLVDFQLPNLKTGQHYFFKGANPFDNRTWISPPITQLGFSTFTIGNKLLNVTVTSGIDNTPLANQSVIIYLRLENGSRKGFRTVTTDSNGKLSLDLPGLGSGTRYELRTLPKHGKLAMYSGEISDAGNFAFKVGNVRVKAVDGLTNAAINHHKIRVYKHAENGTNTSFTLDSTGDSGFVDFYLPNISSAQQYLFKSASLSDNRTWSSNLISAEGLSTFVIGNKLLKVTLVNALDNKPIPNIEVRAYERMPDNSLKWSQKKTSDTNGQIDFDFPGLGSGKKYVLITKPYGVRILSKNITDTGRYKIQAGAIAVTLRKKANNSLLKGHKLYLYEKVAPGKIEKRATSTTNQMGKVHFDPTDLGSGKVYLIRGKNLFGNNQNYYSQWILSKGRYDFIVAPDDPHKLDEEAPKFGQFHPANKSILSDNGFALKIQVTDNNRVKNVAIRIIDPVKGTTPGQATLSNNEWGFLVTKNMISKDKTIIVIAEAIDQTGNKSTVRYQYSIINDIRKPTLTITSHQNNNQVDEHGFLLTGTVSDNAGYVKLLATVIDPIKGKITDRKELEVGKNNHWALLVKDLSRGQNIIVKLESTDSANNITNKQLSLSVMTDNESMIQLINRITFGATPQLLKELRDNGSNSFIDQQLHPELIDDSVFEQQLTALLANETISYRKLHHSQVAHATSSKRQLLEIMTQFWESHFNTDLSVVRYTTYEREENKLFRQHALGNFKDLLHISATSPAMLKYLDNVENHKDEPNENYARELMELHTLGVDNSYTSDDIKEVARAFTGWRIRKGAFYFNNKLHDIEEKNVLDLVIPSNSGVEGGKMVLDLLAEHNSTAQFICSKLLHTFVSDAPSSSSINQCASNFITHIDKEDQIAKVLEGIFKSTAFSDSLNFHSKIKTPFEFVIGLYRQLPVFVNYSKTQASLSNMGMPLFYFALPTGWPEKANDVINSNRLMQRWKFTNDILSNPPYQWKSHIVEPNKFLINAGFETTEGVLGYFLETTLAHDYSELEKNEALSILTNNQTEKFDIYAPDAEIKIRNLMALILKYPAYQLQ